MPSSIRTRLLLLVACCVVPALLAALWALAETARREREANERTLRETARAMSLVVERELSQRLTIAHLLAASPLLDDAPRLDAAAERAFARQSREAMRGFQGTVELLGADAPAGVGPLMRGGDGVLRAAVVMPVERDGRRVASLALTVLPAELQALVDAQHFPDEFFAAVVDGEQTLVARAPGGAAFAGRRVSDDLLPQMQARREGLFEATSLEGRAVVGWFSTLSHGWSFLVAMPQPAFAGYRGGTVLRVGLAAAALLALSLGAALWVARGIVRCVVSLREAAVRMRSGEAVEPARGGIAECDDVGEALSAASKTLRGARSDLERQVAEAVALTREAEQRASQSRRLDALGRLTGGVAHDFNNLLGVISNSVHLIERHAGDRPQVKLPLAATMRAVEVGSRLTQHLVRFAGRRPVRPQVIDLSRWLPELHAMLGSVLGNRTEVVLEVEPGTWCVTVESSELELALINLALNARDAMPRGGTLRVAARNARREDAADAALLGALPPRDHVLIAVGDDGAGMAPELTARAFEPFFTTKGVGRGTGLGLAQVHGFCSQAGGAVRIESRDGHGTTVTLLLPAGDGALLAAPATAAPAARPRLDGVHLLLVEDNRELGDVTEALLREHGARVSRAVDADEALQRVLEDAGGADAIGLVLSDVVMPGALDGAGLAAALRARRPGLPVVLISGYSSAPAEREGVTVLHKPCTAEELLHSLRRAVDTGG